MIQKVKKTINLLQEFSLPLIMGVVAALVFANIDYEAYENIIHRPFLGQEFLSLHFFFNEIFMALFFGIAAKEITESFLPGGSLNPVKKAFNPLMGTLGGVFGPVGVFFLLTHVFGQTHLNNGWGIPTATDIALAWLAARLIFGQKHPAIDYLLLLAIVDDAIGLGIIAVFYGDPERPVVLSQLLWVVLAMGLSYVLRWRKVHSWTAYIFGPGLLSWHGLHAAHLHPALALVPIVPFLPHGLRDKGLYVVEEEEKEGDMVPRHSTLEEFEHQNKLIVDFGLFFFAFANAGVQFSSVDTITWIILSALLFGKVIGITLFSSLAMMMGIPLPTGMDFRHLLATSAIAGLGLTVALFVCGAAYTGDLAYAQGPAKMGALFSVGAFFFAWAIARGLGLKKEDP